MVSDGISSLEAQLHTNLLSPLNSVLGVGDGIRKRWSRDQIFSSHSFAQPALDLSHGARELPPSLQGSTGRMINYTLINTTSLTALRPVL